MMEKLLRVENLDAGYGLIQVLFGISLEVNKGEAVSLLGRNGMGKSTTLKSIMGILPPTSGRVWFDGSDITGLPSHVIANKGVGYIPEDRRIFPFLTVLENLQVPKKNTRRGWSIAKAFDLFPHLKALERRKGCHLSGGEQQMLTIARTLVGNPQLILLDEPSEGLAPLVNKILLDQLLQIKKDGLSILLSEQNIRFAETLCEHLYIIEKGKIPYQGNFQDLQENQLIKRAHLGV
jgi:branched-chain amino acid transport system ATP-binding protein